MAKPLTLATWLEQAIDRIVPAGGPIGPVVYEGILRMATTGRSGMLESVLHSAARNAVAMNQPVHNLLNQLDAIHKISLERLDEELNPDVAWRLLVELEAIFQRIITITVESYVAAFEEAQQAKLAEGVRIHQEAEQMVFDYAAKLAQANRQLSRLEQAKTDFISIAAHELKTPLSIVQGYVNMLDELVAQADTGKTQTIVDGIVTGVERMTTMVDSLLDISAIETGTLVLELSPVAVGSLIKLVVTRLEDEAKSRQHQFELGLASDLPPVVTDSKRLYQVMYQLVNNAIKYTPDKGRIKISTCLEEDITIGASYIKIEVSDTGIGIAPEHWEQIFDKFYRTGEISLHSSGRIKFKGAGPGLGLSIAKGIIEALGGEVWAESPGYDEVNCPGSIFHVRLPATPPQP